MSFVGIADAVEGFPIPSRNIRPAQAVGLIIGLCDREIRQLAQGIRHFRGESRGLFVDVADGAIVFSAKEKLELFKRLILDMGIGAKTNVGFGKFREGNPKRNVNTR